MDEMNYMKSPLERNGSGGRRGNATDSDGGATATELFTLVAPSSKGGLAEKQMLRAV